MSYTVREVDASDDEIAETIHDFNRAAEPEWRPFPVLEDHELEGPHCYWWLAYQNDEPVAFAGLVPSRLYKNAGYLKRAGVVPEHRGHGLQLRFLRAREAKARKIGWSLLVTETVIANTPSQNNLIKGGFRLFEPKEPWARDSIYWRKFL